MKTLCSYWKQVIEALKRLLEQLRLTLPIVFSDGNLPVTPLFISSLYLIPNRMAQFSFSLSEVKQMSRDGRKHASNAFLNAVWALGEFGAVEGLELVEALAERDDLPLAVKEELQQVAEKLRLLSTPPSVPDFSAMSIQNLPTLPNPTAVPIDSLPRPAIKDPSGKNL
ncbi:MAG: hypothetical protein N3B10_10555 [Armatimonadetes bacterium]|nr:hypothetical protein [Armatimonadota bacterium]MCX7968907.1 hypothetical protein [Armatimonadota bacterium]MDW8143478.1 hypothetical protein [Armatimonadota bacterium]